LSPCRGSCGARYLVNALRNPWCCQTCRPRLISAPKTSFSSTSDNFPVFLSTRLVHSVHFLHPLTSCQIFYFSSVRPGLPNCFFLLRTHHTLPLCSFFSSAGLQKDPVQCLPSSACSENFSTLHIFLTFFPHGYSVHYTFPKRHSRIEFFFRPSNPPTLPWFLLPHCCCASPDFKVTFPHPLLRHHVGTSFWWQISIFPLRFIFLTSCSVHGKRKKSSFRTQHVLYWIPFNCIFFPIFLSFQHSQILSWAMGARLTCRFSVIDRLSKWLVSKC